MDQRTKEYQKQVAEILIRDYFSEDEDWVIGTETVTKNNNTKLAAITICKRNDAMAMNFYVDGYLYENFEPEATAQSIYESYQKEAKSQDSYLKFDTSIITDWNKAKNNIFYKVINANANQSYLQEAPYILLSPDLAICFYIWCNDEATVNITDRMIEAWGIPKDQIAQHLYDIAEANIKQTKPALCSPIIDVLREMLPPEIYEDFKENNRLPAYVLTNKNKKLGAAAMAYGRGQVLNDCLEQMEKDLGKPVPSVYIIPSSIHEIILMAATSDIDVGDLHATIKQMNSTEVPQNEMLSDEVFYYDKNEGLTQLTFNTMVISR